MMEMLITDYLKAWNLSDPQPLAVTATSCVYTVRWNGQQTVLKVLTPVGMRDEKSGAVALRCFNGKAAVRLLRYDHQAQLLEYAEGEDLKLLVQKGDDEGATSIIGDVLNRLHLSHKGVAPEGLISLRLRFRSLFERAQREGSEGVSSVYTRAADVADALLSTQENCCVLHGDMHHENVRHSARRGWLAIDPKGLFGERTFDAANVLCNPVSMPDLVANETRLMRNAEILSRALKIETERLLAFTFAYASLSAVWSIEDGQDPSLALRIADLTEP
jgi:streptomycin 6-kinase